MDIKKKLFIAIAAFLVAGFVIYNLFTPERERGSNFTASIPKPADAGGNGAVQLKLYFDISGSMRGFVDFGGVAGNNATSKMLSTLTSFLDNAEADCNAQATCYAGGNVYNKDTFRRNVQNRSAFSGQTTLLQDLIEQTAVYANDTCVVAIATDMVLSFGRQKLIEEGDTAYNLHQIDQLVSSIHAAMTQAKQRGLDVALLQYVSDFNGNFYYDYTENLKGNAYRGRVMKERPWYLLLIGKEDNLKQLLAKGCAQKPENICTSLKFNEKDDAKQAPFVIDEKHTAYTHDGKPEQTPNKYWIKGHEEKDEGAFYTTSSLNKDDCTTFALSCAGFDVPAWLYSAKTALSAECSEGAASASEPAYNEKQHTLAFDATLKPYKDLDRDGEACIKICVTNDMQDCSLDDDLNQPLAGMQGKTWQIMKVVETIHKVFGDNDKQEIATFKFKYSKH